MILPFLNISATIECVQFSVIIGFRNHKLCLWENEAVRAGAACVMLSAIHSVMDYSMRAGLMSYVGNLQSLQTVGFSFLF